MSIQHHKDHPEIWLRPSPSLPLEVLLRLIESRIITATPRLGARTSGHPKGYSAGQVITMRVLDSAGVEIVSHQVLVNDVIVKPLEQYTAADLVHTYSYSDWKDVQRELSFFEKREVADTEDMSIIEFSYL